MDTNYEETRYKLGGGGTTKNTPSVSYESSWVGLSLLRTSNYQLSSVKFKQLAYKSRWALKLYTFCVTYGVWQSFFVPLRSGVSLFPITSGVSEIEVSPIMAPICSSTSKKLCRAAQASPGEQTDGFVLKVLLSRRYFISLWSWRFLWSLVGITKWNPRTLFRIHT